MNKDNETYMKLYYQQKRHHRLVSKRTKTVAFGTIVFVLFCFVVANLCGFEAWNESIFAGFFIQTQNYSSVNTIIQPQQQEFPLRCTNNGTQLTCPRDYPTSHNPSTNHSRPMCPSYFRFIHEDLRPWKETGIKREMVEGARRTAYFRLVILDGRVYVEKYRESTQTRDLFTLWGILQLLRLYPGKLPDLELLFDTNDRPHVPKDMFQGPNALTPPPLFKYCSDQSHFDIVFPDWSFWGWPETNIKPWNYFLKDIREGNKKTNWKDRVPYAYWKGNPLMAETRKDLMKCNVSETNDWNTRLYRQDWNKEINEGFKKSNLADQCTHRYKIYIEGRAWSVSEKYILACDSMTLYVNSSFYDFFVRGMEPLKHYWPIRDYSKCTALKFAVEWGNNHIDKAQEIGKAASKFIQEDLNMENVYDYMFHLLNEYAKLLRFKPTIPKGAVEYFPETLACAVSGNWRKFMEETMVKFPSDSNPCTLPPPYDPSTLQGVLERKDNSIRQVESWEDEYWHSKQR